MTQTNGEEKITVGSKWLEGFMQSQHERSYAEGKRAGMQDATRIEIGEDYGSVTSIIRVEAPSRRALSRKVKELDRGHIDTGCGHDCSGRLCGQSAFMLRAYRFGQTWYGVVEVNQSYDV